GVSVPAQKGKPRGASAKQKPDKSRTPSRPPGRQSKKPSPRTPQNPAPAVIWGGLGGLGVAGGVSALSLQRIPFTVSRARDAILFVAEWRFPRDTDPERDGIWSEDEEPQTCPLDSRTPCVAPVDYEGSLSSEEVRRSPTSPGTRPGRGTRGVTHTGSPVSPLSPNQSESEDLPEPAEAEGPDGILTQPPEEGRRLSRDTERDGILTQPPEEGRRLSRDPGRDGILAQPPERDRQLSRDHGRGGTLAARPAEKGRRLSWASGSGSILTKPAERGSHPSRPPQPRPAPQDVPQRRAPVPTAPSEPPAQTPQVSPEGAAKVTYQVPPPPPPGPSLAPGVPRLGARRVAARWVLPEVKVVDVSNEPEWGRAAPSRSRLVLSGVLQVTSGTGRARKAEPQLCDPWLASARLAPGVTVRWGRSERRGPALPEHGGQEDDEEDDEAVKSADKELKPILAYPECRLSEYDE
uniref:Uncharacterized protein n=1 Tax=Cyanoderma ruficeps TaxID=181631 RepID=A0A8C3RAT7_9PASS